MDTINKAMFYLFVMGIVLIAAAYYAGTVGLLKAIFGGVNTLDLTATGRNAQGTFGAYPTGG